MFKLEFNIFKLGFKLMINSNMQKLCKTAYMSRLYNNEWFGMSLAFFCLEQKNQNKRKKSCHYSQLQKSLTEIRLT